MVQPIDYDLMPNPFFNLTVFVQDPDVTHVDTAHVEIRVTDYNDNAPVFVPSTKRVRETSWIQYFGPFSLFGFDDTNQHYTAILALSVAHLL